MLPQEPMIERLREVCRQDGRLTAAMLYGSFTLGEADAFSDIDVVLFFADQSLPEFDQKAWVNQIAPVALYYLNEFGNGVAIFENLVRAEFHFDPASEMGRLEKLQGDVWFPSFDSTILVDKTGQLARYLEPLVGPPTSHNTPQDVRCLCESLLNWCLFGTNVLARGELARALEILNVVHGYLLRMARLVEGVDERWISPAKSLEWELAVESYRRYQSCTSSLDRGSLWKAYLSAWEWGNENLSILASRHSVDLPAGLVGKIGQRLKELSG